MAMCARAASTASAAPTAGPADLSLNLKLKPKHADLPRSPKHAARSAAPTAAPAAPVTAHKARRFKTTRAGFERAGAPQQEDAFVRAKRNGSRAMSHDRRQGFAGKRLFDEDGDGDQDGGSLAPKALAF